MRINFFFSVADVQQPATLWWNNFLDVESQRNTAQCNVCGDLRAQQAALVIRRGDPLRKEKEAQRTKLGADLAKHRYSFSPGILHF